MNDRVQIEVRDGVAEVRLVRPDKMNALDPAMFKAISAAGETVGADPSVRVVVLSGEGRAFCAGLDTSTITETADASQGEQGTAVLDDDSRSLSERTYGIANGGQQVVWVWRELPVPVIAALHGVAFGGGFQIALGADIRIVHPETKLSVRELRWGLVPDMGGTALMRRMAPADVVRALTYTARVFTGTEAKELGFATHVSETPREDALELAATIAARSPSAVRAAKRLLNGADSWSDEESLLQESLEQEKIMGRENRAEAVRSEFEGRPAVFKDHR